ncbi:FAD-binding oxidoreductase [Lysobacter pythonis]|uniref:FAD-binding oxidoreductase n=1 Tax=Solilutibacter pythonis TaxID=2483112 RepID=A0A3M2HP10_9GAMM|nr:FAD-binding oxidoreductase [Lysobacter pythonis]RMH90768.1 FAD-binding oxidoreductase [Lysobacter pythonis]
MDARLDALRQILPGPRLLNAPDDLEHYGRDWTRRWTPAPLAVALPATVEEVVGIVRWAREHRVALVPSGGRTGLSGGAVAANGELVLSLERMNKVLAFDAIDRTVEVQAGIALEAVHNIAREHGLQYPVDFASRGSCSIGGNIATNAGGIRVLRYGNTREWIAGLTVVTGAGELLRLNKGLVKNSSGYDLRQLFIGAEGTLGVVVEATLRLAAPPPPTRTMLLALADFDAVIRAFMAMRAGLRLEAFEFFTSLALKHVVEHGAQPPFDDDYPFHAVVEYAHEGEADEAAALALFERGLVEGWALDGVIAGSQAQAAQLWRLREGVTEALAPRLPYKNDVSVRISALPAFLHEAEALISAEYPHFEVVWFGHIGDGNLHINVLKPTDMAQADFVRDCERVTRLLAEVLARHGGSISAEHGIGLVKKPYLTGTRSEEEVAAMRAIKRALDPDGIMNPGKLFDP